jgi:uncharacterized protein YuzB (UPF0349 family)
MVVATDGNQEEDHLHVIKHMDPLLSFRALSTDIKHSICQVAQVKYCLTYPCRPQSCPQDILVGGEVVSGEQAVDLVEEAA